MALHKLTVDQFYEDSYSLIAMHCALDDYRMAYLLNKQLQIKLERKDRDIDFEYTLASYSIYEWQDEKQFATWHLVGNICKREEKRLDQYGFIVRCPSENGQDL